MQNHSDGNNANSLSFLILGSRPHKRPFRGQPSITRGRRTCFAAARVQLIPGRRRRRRRNEEEIRRKLTNSTYLPGNQSMKTGTSVSQTTKHESNADIYLPDNEIMKKKTTPTWLTMKVWRNRQKPGNLVFYAQSTSTVRHYLPPRQKRKEKSIWTHG